MDTRGGRLVFPAIANIVTGLPEQMTTLSIASGARLLLRVKQQFVDRDVIFNDGRNLKRVSIAGRTQALMAGAAGFAIVFSGYGVARAAVDTAAATGIITPTSADTRLAVLQTQVATLRDNVATIRRSAAVHAARVEQRQALIAAAVTGRPAQQTALNIPAVDPRADAVAGDVVAPLRQVEQRQAVLAGRIQAVAEQRYRMTADRMRMLGIAPERFAETGGPYEAANSAEATADMRADQQFRSLFQTWRRLDNLQQATIAIPSAFPVATLSFTSNYGVRRDPFRGTMAMHAGVDIPGPVGTPVYATADGMVDRAGQASGYGNLVEIDHGRGIQTRYGHLSRILVAPNSYVHRGQLIALMGSTGRSTGPHLHYEVRIDGHAVNPAPFLQNADYLLAAQDRALRTTPVALTSSALVPAGD